MNCSINLTREELVRYSGQIKLTEIGMEGQEKIKGASVLVIGAGGIGCPVLLYLASAGVGTLGIFDNDCVDESNLHRQILYSAKEIGKPKPLAAKEKLKELNPDITYKVHFLKLDRQSALNVIRDYDIICDCTDNFETRYIINDASLILNRPVVYGAIHKFSGQVIVLNYRNGPTLRCLFPGPPHPVEFLDCTDEGILGSVAGIVGTMQATEVIKVILGTESVLSGKLFSFNALDYNVSITPFTRKDDLAVITELTEPDDDHKQLIVKEITAADLRDLISLEPGTMIFDLRDKDDIAEIGFKTIREKEITRIMELTNSNVPMVFYCRSGARAISIISYLRNVHKGERLFSLIL